MLMTTELAHNPSLFRIQAEAIWKSVGTRGTLNTLEAWSVLFYVIIFLGRIGKQSAPYETNT